MTLINKYDNDVKYKKPKQNHPPCHNTQIACCPIQRMLNTPNAGLYKTPTLYPFTKPSPATMLSK